MPQTTDQPTVPAIIRVLAEWEDANGSLSGILPEEWMALLPAVSDAAAIQSPRMARAVPLVAEAPMEPVAGLTISETPAGPAFEVSLGQGIFSLNLPPGVYPLYAAPPVSVAPMPEEMGDAAIERLAGEYIAEDWEPDRYYRNMNVIAFARALLASVAPQPEQPNTEQPHLADNGEQAVQGLDADLAPRYYCNKCGSFPDAVQHKRPDGTDCPYIARTAHGVALPHSRPRCRKEGGMCAMTPDGAGNPATGICPECGVDCGNAGVKTVDGGQQ